MSASLFQAQMLRASPRSYASHAAELLVEGNPACATAWGEGSVRRWQDLLARVVEDVASAVEFEEPAILRDAVGWHREAFRVRGAPMEHLQAALIALRDALADGAPTGQTPIAPAMLDEVLSEPPPAPVSRETSLDANDACGKLALRYLEAVLDARRREATALVLEAMDGGLDVGSIYERVLLPAEAEAGRMWHLGELTIGEEHFISETVRSTMSVVCQRATSRPARGVTVVVGAVQHDRHDIGTRGACDLFELEGFRAVSLGGDVPSPDLVQAVHDWEAGVVVLSVAMCVHLPRAREAVGSLKAAYPQLRVIVGGAGFLGLDSLAERVGADALARTPSDAVRLAGDLG